MEVYDNDYRYIYDTLNPRNIVPKERLQKDDWQNNNKHIHGVSNDSSANTLFHYRDANFPNVTPHYKQSSTHKPENSRNSPNYNCFDYNNSGFDTFANTSMPIYSSDNMIYPTVREDPSVAMNDTLPYVYDYRNSQYQSIYNFPNTPHNNAIYYNSYPEINRNYGYENNDTVSSQKSIYDKRKQLFPVNSKNEDSGMYLHSANKFYYRNSADLCGSMNSNQRIDDQNVRFIKNAYNGNSEYIPIGTVPRPFVPRYSGDSEITTTNGKDNYRGYSYIPTKSTTNSQVISSVHPSRRESAGISKSCRNCEESSHDFDHKLPSSLQSSPSVVNSSQLSRSPLMSNRITLSNFTLPSPLSQSSPIVRGSSLFTKIKRQVCNALSQYREGYKEHALCMMQNLCTLYPMCYMVWLEKSRIEDSAGDIVTAEQTLVDGLKYLPLNEALLEKRMRLEERLRNICGVKECVLCLLSIKTARGTRGGIDGIVTLGKMGLVWYALLLFEETLKLTTTIDPQCMLDYARFLFKVSSFEKGRCLLINLSVSISDCCPLWFYYIQITEQYYTLCWNEGEIKKRSMRLILSSLIECSITHISDELQWKLFCNASLVEFRSFTHVRRYFRHNCSRLSDEYFTVQSVSIETSLKYLRKSIECCTENYKWKIWLNAAKYFAAFGWRNTSKLCILRCAKVVPNDDYSAMIQNISKLVEALGYFEESFLLLEESDKNNRKDWRLALDRVFRLLHLGKYDNALHLCSSVVSNFLFSGRIWSAFIQILHSVRGAQQSYIAFKNALKYVPKSGEVWCEGARIFLNPTSCLFNPDKAQKCINNAVFFSPQYGDSFLEAIRLSMITSDLFLSLSRGNSPAVLSHILSSFSFKPIVLKCVFSDPNYGYCWFSMKSFPLQAAENVIMTAIKVIAYEVAKYSDLYFDALMALAERNITEYRFSNHNNNRGITSETSNSVYSIFRNNRRVSNRNYSPCKDRPEDHKLSFDNMCNLPCQRFSHLMNPFYFKHDGDRISTPSLLKILFGTSQIEGYF